MKRCIGWLVTPWLMALTLLGCDEGGDMEVNGINPPAGHIQGDQPVRISGANFRQDIGYTVYFGNEKAKSVTIGSPEELVVVTPKGDPGAVDVTVRADDGNAFVIREGFSYEDMGGSVVEGLGDTPGGKEKGNLAY